MRHRQKAYIVDSRNITFRPAQIQVSATRALKFDRTSGSKPHIINFHIFFDYAPGITCFLSSWFTRSWFTRSLVYLHGSLDHWFDHGSLHQVRNRIILTGFVPCILLNFKASAAETGIYHGLKTSMPYSCITRQSMKIKSRLFQVHNRKRCES
jgi:hypothetical protein